mmetsp:Transcript_33266/g.82365  ORF Transcript_33266/g.82365 Transcript_33266/m.82365 type:complete len:289 (+) Transcript_33266:169-1035(+)
MHTPHTHRYTSPRGRMYQSAHHDRIRLSSGFDGLEYAVDFHADVSDLGVPSFEVLTLGDAKVDDALALVDVALQVAVQYHAGRHLLGLAGVHLQQRPELTQQHIAVHLGGRQHIVLEYGAVEYCGAVSEGGLLVLHQSLCEFGHFCASYDAFVEHLLEHTVALQLGHTVVLHQNGEEARPLRASRCQDGACAGILEELLQVLLIDLQVVEVQRQVIVPVCCELELTLRVHNAGIRHFVSEVETDVVHLVDDHRRTSAVGLGRHGILVFEEELGYLDILLGLLCHTALA